MNFIYMRFTKRRSMSVLWCGGASFAGAVCVLYGDYYTTRFSWNLFTQSERTTLVHTYYVEFLFRATMSMHNSWHIKFTRIAFGQSELKNVFYYFPWAFSNNLLVLCRCIGLWLCSWAWRSYYYTIEPGHIYT